MDMDMIDSEHKCSSSSAAHNRVCTSGPRRGKVFLPPPPLAEKQPVAADDPLPSSSNDCRVDDEASALSVENYANLFFGSDDDDDDDNSMTLNSSIHSLAMSKHHHCWEAELHLLPTSSSSSSSSSTRSASIVPLLPPTTDRRKRRRVSFTTSTPTIHTLLTVPPSSKMTPSEKSTSWLQPTDIESLKSSALSTIQTVRNRISSSNAREYQHRNKFRALMVTIENETDSSIRGLEHKVYRRKETRRMLIQDVMDCQHYITGLERFGHVMSMDEKRRLLANASLKKSRVCVKRALLDASDDYKEVYGNNHHHHLGQYQYHHDCIPSPLKPEAMKIRRVSSGAVTDDCATKSSL